MLYDLIGLKPPATSQALEYHLDSGLSGPSKATSFPWVLNNKEHLKPTPQLRHFLKHYRDLYPLPLPEKGTKPKNSWSASDKSQIKTFRDSFIQEVHEFALSLQRESEWLPIAQAFREREESIVKIGQKADDWSLVLKLVWQGVALQDLPIVREYLKKVNVPANSTIGVDVHNQTTVLYSKGIKVLGAYPGPSIPTAPQPATCMLKDGYTGNDMCHVSLQDYTDATQVLFHMPRQTLYANAKVALYLQSWSMESGIPCEELSGFGETNASSEDISKLVEQIKFRMKRDIPDSTLDELTRVMIWRKDNARMIICYQDMERQDRILDRLVKFASRFKHPISGKFIPLRHLMESMSPRDKKNPGKRPPVSQGVGIHWMHRLLKDQEITVQEFQTALTYTRQNLLRAGVEHPLLVRAMESIMHDFLIRREDIPDYRLSASFLLGCLVAEGACTIRYIHNDARANAMIPGMIKGMPQTPKLTLASLAKSVVLAANSAQARKLNKSDYFLTRDFDTVMSKLDFQGLPERMDANDEAAFLMGYSAQQVLIGVRLQEYRQRAEDNKAAKLAKKSQID